MIGPALPALDPGAARARPSPAHGSTAQHGPSAFDDAVGSAARKPNRQAAPSRDSHADHSPASSTGRSTPAAEKSDSDEAAATEAEQASPSPDGKADGTAAHRAKHDDADEDEGEGKGRKKDGQNAGAAALPLVLGQTIVILAKAKDGEEAQPSSRETTKSTATPAKAASQHAAADDAAGNDAAVHSATADRAKAEAASVRFDGRSGTGSALSDLRVRLSQADTAGAHASPAKAPASPKDERPPLEGKTQQSDSSDREAGSPRNGHGTTAAAMAAAPAQPETPVSLGGPLQGRNIATLADAIAARPDWSQALTPAAGAASGSTSAAPVTALKLQLNPADLGMVTATLRVSGNQLVINLQVQTAEAYRQLSSGNDAILDKLKGHGYAVENITVQHIAVSGPAGSPQAQQQQHQQQPGFTSQQGGQHTATGGGQRFSGQGQGQNGSRPAPFLEPAASLASEPGSDTRSGGRGAGGVYV